MIINHNCCIKLVPLVIFIYDARSHIHHAQFNLRCMGLLTDRKASETWELPASNVLSEIGEHCIEKYFRS